MPTMSKMPASARKSSIGDARRGMKKAHIPYRGDNPAVGKKTGIAVRNVERMSDGFEPFEEIMQQADRQTPPMLAKVKRKKRSAVVIEDDEADENGEMSMDLDYSPMHTYTSARQLATPTKLSRVLSTSRIVAQSPELGFDEVPSPRPRSMSRKSMANAGPGPSRLSMASTFRHSSPESNLIDQALHRRTRPSDVNGYAQSYLSPGPQNTSFTQMDQDDDDDEGNEPFQEPDVPFISDPPEIPEPEDMEEDEEPPEKPSTRSKRGLEKSKSKEFEVEQRDSGDEMPDVRNDMDDMEQAEHEEPAPEPEPQRSSKSKRAKEKATPDELNTLSTAAERPPKRAKKENKAPKEGVRRSTREHIRPLEWWRGERYVYGRDLNLRSNEPVFVAPIKEIMRIPKEPTLPLGAKRKRSSRGRSKSRVVEQPPILYNPEEGWDDDTNPMCRVLEYPGKEEAERRIAFTAKMYNPNTAANSEWKYQRIFGDDLFIAAGQLSIPVKGRKPSKNARDNTYIFYVVEGAVNFKVHDTSIILTTGGMVMVPRGNTYYIENIADREAKLVFTQARKMPLTEEELQYLQEQEVINHQSQERRDRRSTETAPGKDSKERRSKS